MQHQNYVLQVRRARVPVCKPVLGVGILIVLYASYCLPEQDRLGRFYALLLAFAGITH